jgi:hypothetical protein
VSTQQWEHDPLIERLVNAAITAGRRSLGEAGALARRTVVVDPALDQQQRQISLAEGEVRLSSETYEALKRLFYTRGFRWTDVNPARAAQSAQALGALHARAVAAAQGESDTPRPDRADETLAGYRLRTGVREAFLRSTRGAWLRQLGVEEAAPDVATLPFPVTYPGAGRTAEALAFYLAERREAPAGDVLRDLARAGDAAPARIAQYAIEGYDPQLWAHVQGLDERGRGAVVRRIVDPVDRVWRGGGGERAEGRATLAGVGAAVGVHQAVLEVAEEVGLRRGAAEGRSLEREKAEYAVHGAYVAWAKSSGPARVRALAGRASARGALAAVVARERGETAVRGIASRTASLGPGVENTVRAVTGPVAEQVQHARTWVEAERSRNAGIRAAVDDGGFGF